MKIRLLVPFAALGIACGDTPPQDAPAAPGAGAQAVPLSGTYRVAGTTVDKATGAKRDVAGTIVVKAEGSSYTTTFSLNTTLREGGEPQKAELIGHGEGTVAGRALAGTAETQLIVALVPGVDAGFGMLPRAATRRILNRSEATIEPTGRVVIEIESDPAPGEDYSPTHTTLRGERLADLGIAGEGDAAEGVGGDAANEAQ
jgi:hypothetical protein